MRLGESKNPQALKAVKPHGRLTEPTRNNRKPFPRPPAQETKKNKLKVNSTFVSCNFCFMLFMTVWSYNSVDRIPPHLPLYLLFLISGVDTA
ncbi:hypothetical protein BDV25DRAFT_47227 [Aspergillus avenaceus]|uniref:Uncharacterized protein n=1 Tax=Aspergillus avenaceus TaxID=36643 RepID=A0A5N6TK40_ASPAV|nr:hypothetical protein BDV25DRAFT_47227 [Aspergillus avenaceus]